MMIAAFGGSVEDFDENELMELQQAADEQGITIEELIAQMQLGQEEDEEMMGEKEYEEAPVEEDSADYYAMGGNVPIEVEGEEVVESPNGNLKKIVGPKHEQGGVDINAARGTSIYSDRLSVDGKSMADRKVDREKRLSKLEKLGETSSSSPTANTIKRTSQIIEMEEQKDMALQQIANKLYGQSGEAAYGDNVGDFVRKPSTTTQYNNIEGFDANAYMKRWGQYVPEIFDIKQPNPIFDIKGNYRLPKEVPTVPALTEQEEGFSVMPDNFLLNPQEPNLEDNNVTPIQLSNPNNVGKYTFKTTNDFIGDPAAPASPTIEEDEINDSTLGLGDYVGMAGNLFNAVAPIINTQNAANATKPNINRYKGFGNKALQTNQAAQGYANAMRSNATVNLNSSNNAAIARNRGGARSVNTMRALDIATDIGANKASNNIDNSFSQQMIQLLGQEGQLENMQDQMEMRGATDVDLRNQQDLDNYYSNMGQNLVNAGTNVQGLGKSLNVARSNQDGINDRFIITESYTSYVASSSINNDVAEIFGIEFSNIEKPHPDCIGFYITRNERTDEDKTIIDNAIFGSMTEFEQYKSFGLLAPKQYYTANNCGKTDNANKTLQYFDKGVWFFNPEFQYFQKKTEFDEVVIEGTYTEASQNMPTISNVNGSTCNTGGSRGLYIEDVQAGTPLVNPDLNPKGTLLSI